MPASQNCTFISPDTMTQNVTLVCLDCFLDSKHCLRALSSSQASLNLHKHVSCYRTSRLVRKAEISAMPLPCHCHNLHNETTLGQKAPVSPSTCAACAHHYLEKPQTATKAGADCDAPHK
ncbi:hypothetical protein BsWGS_22782 [Bradybaena similaris]